MNPEIEAALARLEQTHGAFMFPKDSSGYCTSELTKPLAALIRAIAEPEECRDASGESYGMLCIVCGDNAPDHAPDCALLALVRAINGGTTP